MALMFEDYLKNNLQEDLVSGNEFNIKVFFEEDDTISLYIHPIDRDGESFDGFIKGSMIVPKGPVLKLKNFLENAGENNCNTTK